MLNFTDILVKCAEYSFSRYFIVVDNNVIAKRNQRANLGLELAFSTLSRHLQTMAAGTEAKIYFSNEYQHLRTFTECTHQYDFKVPEKEQAIKQLITLQTAKALAIKSDDLKAYQNELKAMESNASPISLEKYLEILDAKHKLQTELILAKQEINALKAEANRPKFLDRIGDLLESNAGLISSILQKPQPVISGIGTMEPQQVTSETINATTPPAMNTNAERLKNALQLWKEKDPNFIERVEWLANFAATSPGQYKAVINFQGIGNPIP